MIFLTFLAACDVKREWKEEVKLANGSVIVAERTSVRERIGELGAAGHGRFKEEVLVVRQPRLVEWRGDTSPIALEVDRDSVFVVGWLRGWDACQKYGYPRPPFAYFRNTAAGGWQQITREDAPVHMSPNLLLNPWQKPLEETKKVVDLSMKEQLNRSVYSSIPSLKDFHARRDQIDERVFVKCVRSDSKS